MARFFVFGIREVLSLYVVRDIQKNNVRRENRSILITIWFILSIDGYTTWCYNYSVKGDGFELYLLLVRRDSEKREYLLSSQNKRRVENQTQMFLLGILGG